MNLVYFSCYSILNKKTYQKKLWLSIRNFKVNLKVLFLGVYVCAHQNTICERIFDVQIGSRYNLCGF